MKYIIPALIVIVLFIGCDSKPSPEPTQTIPTIVDTPKTIATVLEPEPVQAMPDLPPEVVYKNWEIGDLQNNKVVADLYKAWDTNNPGDMVEYFADSALLELPDGKRLWVTKETAKARLRKWRGYFKETTNSPISLMSLRDKDTNEQWVIAWIWNKWRDDGGGKDSMFYCDNWQLRDKKVIYMNSLDHQPSRQLAKTLNKMIAQ
jgi:hypothetical protein